MKILLIILAILTWMAGASAHYLCVVWLNRQRYDDFNNSFDATWAGLVSFYAWPICLPFRIIDCITYHWKKEK